MFVMNKPRPSRRIFFYWSALLVAAFPLCASAQIVVNGDFSAGNVGFGTDYSLVATNHTVSTVPPDYAIATDPSVNFTNGYPSLTDHTTGSGNMLFADGAGSSSTRIWYETLTLSSNTTYIASAWVAPADGTNLPTLQFLADGVPVGSSFTTAATTDVWQNFTATFNSGGSSSVVLALVDLDTQSFNNDFGLDDISVSAIPEPAMSAVAIGVAALAGAFSAWRRRAGRAP